MSNTEEVLVVGAGPVGLVAACQLARLGVHVRVIDALTQRTTQSRAVGIQARSLEMLASLGVLPRLEGRGRRMRALEVVSGRTGGIRARLDLETISSRHPYVLDVAQPDTEAVLEERATELGVVIQRGVELTALAQDGDGVEVNVRSSAGDRTGRFGWVVGADGGHTLADTRMGGLVQVHDPNWLTYFEVHHAQVPHYRHGRVLLAGDAAHIHSPIGAQGMNTGIQDAANPSWKLALVAQGRADAALLDTYQDERHPVGAAVVRNTTIFTKVGGFAGPEGAVRNVALFIAGHVQPLGQKIATNVAELTVNYRHSRLSVQDGGHHHGAARAGDHAPDPVGLHRADGSAVSIEELLAHPGLLLLVRSADSDAIRELRNTVGDLGRVVRIVRTAATELGEPEDWVVDADDAIGKRYGLGSDGLALIRPDGYLGLVANPADPGVLRRHLRDALGVVELSTV